MIQQVLMGAVKWAEGEGRNVQVTAPGAVTQGDRLLEFMPLRLSQVLLWVLAGVLVDEQNQAHMRRSLYPPNRH